MRALALLLPLALVACADKAGTTTDSAASGDVQPDDREDSADSTTITQADADANGIKVATVGPGRIATELDAQGVIRALDGSIAQVSARYPGRVSALRANVGDRVRAGQMLASIESNLSLSTYGITSPISGVVLSRQAQVGSGAAEGQMLFQVADFSRVWADLNVFGAQINQVAPGQRVTVERVHDGYQVSASVDSVLPGAASASQSTIVRVTLDNLDAQWRPGTAVSGKIITRDRAAAIVVPRTALQTMDGHDAVFVCRAQTYTARAVVLGGRDAAMVEIIDGLQAGEEVVTEQSYLIKADIEKSAAAHDH